jgi:hypothetical protein
MVMMGNPQMGSVSIPKRGDFGFFDPRRRYRRQNKKQLDLL